MNIYKNNLSAEHPKLKYVIYRIICLITFNEYIGQATDFMGRMKKYIREACKGQPDLYASLYNYNVDNHIVEVLWICEDDDMDDLNIKEKAFIFHYDTFNTPQGLNRTRGGYNAKRSKEARENNSKSQKKRYENPEAVETNRQAQLKYYAENPDAREKNRQALIKYYDENPEAGKKNNKALLKCRKKLKDERRAAQLAAAEAVLVNFI